MSGSPDGMPGLNVTIKNRSPSHSSPEHDEGDTGKLPATPLHTTAAHAVDNGSASASPTPDGTDDRHTVSSPVWRRYWTFLKLFLLRHLLAVSLITGILLGVAWPAPGVALSVKAGGIRPVSFTAVVVIFLVSGLKLSTDAIKKAGKEYVIETHK